MKVNVPLALRESLAAEAKLEGKSISQFIASHFTERYNINLPARPVEAKENNDAAHTE